MSQSDIRSGNAERPDNDVVGALERGFRMDFSELLKVLYSTPDKGGADVQHVLLGSLHTEDRKMYEMLASDEVVKSLAESAVKNLFFELPKDSDRQKIVDEFLGAAKCNNPEADYTSFAESYREGDPKKYGDDIDLEPYSDDRAYNDPKSRTIAFLNECVAPLMVKASCAKINSFVTDETSKASALLWKHDRALERGDNDAAISFGRKYLEERHNNESLALFMNGKAGDEKSLYFGGILRGLRKNDFEEFFKDKSGDEQRVVKIDVAPNYEAYSKDYATYWLKNKVQADYDPAFGEDPPDLVYLKEEGVFLTTRNTPDYVRDALKALEEKGLEFRDVEEMYGQNTSDEQTLIAQGVEASDDKTLTLGAFA